jgi:hypothetical protein
MGFDELRDGLARLVRLKEEDLKSGRPSRWILCVEGLEKSMETVLAKYELLRDRYALLKRSNSQLADEVAWLRDQCDDLFQEPAAVPAQPEGGKPDDPAARRYSDRWPK